jgi:hypothetical protein
MNRLKQCLDEEEPPTPGETAESSKRERLREDKADHRPWEDDD